MAPLPPKQVFLIRHAEKTGRREDSGLSPEGHARAAALVEAFPARFGAPDVIIACANVPRSTRPVDTVEPLAGSLGLTIDDRWNTYDTEAVANALLSSTEFADRRVLVCWRHDTLPDLARRLGGPILTWPSKDFSTVWVFDFSPRLEIRMEDQAIDLEKAKISIGAKH